MFGLLLVIVLGVALGVIVKRTGDRDPTNRMLKVMLAGYLLRIGLQVFIRDLPFFSHGAGGDYFQYETHASAIVRYWEINGFTYATDFDLPGLGSTTLPQNLFAVIVYLNGGPSRFGCTALIAFLSSIACLNVYRFAVHVGGDPKIAFRVMLVLYFSPAFLFYTCDMFKDGIVAFLIVSALYASFQLAHKFSFRLLAVVLVYLVALWSVRFYLVFLAAFPFIIGFIGAGSKTVMRPILMVVGLLAVLVFAAKMSSTLSTVVERADSTFEYATAQNSKDFNARGASGVTFDDGGNPLGKLYLKIPYTVFSPFPWQFGSLGFQVGKIDATIFGYLIFRAFRAARELYKRDRTLVLMFLVFLLPLTMAYSMTMANIGLIVRQRLPIVMITGVLATLSWPRPGGARSTYAHARLDVAEARRRRRPTRFLPARNLPV